MELVFRHPEGQAYGGKDVGVGGDRYLVVREGTRQIIRGVPTQLAHLLAPHHWIPTGRINVDPVEEAAQAALEAQRREKALELELEKTRKARAEAEKTADELAKKKQADDEAEEEARRLQNQTAADNTAAAQGKGKAKA